jgi:hypothetical protein
MTKTFQKALLCGVAAAIVASFTISANAQAVCAWPTMAGQCLPPPPGGSIISYPAPFGMPGAVWETQAYVPAKFPTADTIHLAQ